MSGRRRMMYGAVLVLWLAYAGLTLLTVVSPSESMHLTSTSLLVLRLTIVLPVLAIWIVAARGAAAFHDYAKIVQKGKEGRAVGMMSKGLVFGVLYIVLLSLAGAVVPFMRSHGALTWAVMASNYLPLLIMLIAFGLIYAGSQRLQAVTRFTTWTRAVTIMAVVYMVLCGLFVASYYLHPVLSGPASDRSITHVVSKDILIFTIILPYLVSWFLGLLGAVNILKYAAQVPGVLYRRALHDLTIGIVGVVIFAIALQILNLLAPALTGLGLGAILIILYLLIILYAFGFAYIASGARKLTRLEVAR